VSRRPRAVWRYQRLAGPVRTHTASRRAETAVVTGRKTPAYRRASDWLDGDIPDAAILDVELSLAPWAAPRTRCRYPLRGQDHRHRRRMDGHEHGVPVAVQEAEQLCSPLTGFASVPRVPVQVQQITGNAKTSRLSSTANSSASSAAFVSIFASRTAAADPRSPRSQEVGPRTSASRTTPPKADRPLSASYGP
jgi:hypothetical protein